MFKSNIVRSVRPARQLASKGNSIAQFHSYDHTSPIIDTTTIESKILQNSIKFIPEYGFTSDAVIKGIRDLGYSDSIQSALTSKGISSSLESELMFYWLKKTRLDISEIDMAAEIKETREFDRIRALMQKRLHMNAPVINQLQSGLSLLVLPQNFANSTDELHKLSDEIVFKAGDISNDFSWYSKRLSVSSIYVAAELFMCQDTSPSFIKTQEFVHNKLQAVDKFGDAFVGFEQTVAFNAISLGNLIKSQLIRG